MSESGGESSRGRRLAAAGLSLGLLAAGAALIAVAPAPAFSAGAATPLLAGLLLSIYVLALHYSLDVEFRRNTHGVTLVQLPLALGTQIIAPATHALTRLAATLVTAVLERQAPQKALYNLGVAAFEVGAVGVAVGLVDHSNTGPALWLALYVGLVTADVVGVLVLQAIWRILGVKVRGRQVLHMLVFMAAVSVLFTALAVVAVNAARVEPWTTAVMVLLAVWLGAAYRAHRRVASQEKITEQLYAFVKDLRPLTADRAEAADALDRVRVLLHAERLELDVPAGDRWCRLGVVDGGPPERSITAASPLTGHVASTGHSVFHGRDQSGPDTMATPLLGAQGLAGILTATGRLGNARRFDMADLRLLETAGAELSAALELGHLQTDLERAASRDPLTGLCNLREVTARLGELLAAHPHDGLVLAAVAVDSFREVNDTLGHQVGDELLLEVARRLLLAAPEALIGRIGGGRFAVALPAEEAGEAELFGLGLRSQVEGSAQIGPVGTHIRLSVGVVRGPEHGGDAATLIRRAETAMYSARHAHGGPVLWEPAYEVQGQRRLAVVSALREALACGAIGVAFQPKVETLTGRVSGVEALARWTHPALGAIRPDEFVPLAEASGLMGALTATVLRQSLVAAQGWQRRAPGVGVAVNVSADTVLDPCFVTEIAAILRSVGVPAELLTLELTEGVVVSDPQLAAVRMGELRDLGLKLSVDDFGTGYSSLTYLKGLPVDEVKIDKGFVDGLETDPADRAVVRAVVDIAHTLGLKVVAEGVEHEPQQGILRALGVDEVQGYLHARPMPAQEVAQWLRAREPRIRA